MTARETEAVSKIGCSHCNPKGAKKQGSICGAGVRSLPFRVGQHIVCIDSGLSPAANTNSWSGALPHKH